MKVLSPFGPKIAIIKIPKNIITSTRANKPISLNTTAHGKRNTTSTSNTINIKAIIEERIPAIGKP